VSILLIEQNARAALEVADHGYVLETGAIALQGPADELAVDPRVIETYLGAAGLLPDGSPAMWTYQAPVADMLHLLTQVLDAPASWAAQPAFAAWTPTPPREVLEQAARLPPRCWRRPTPGRPAGLHLEPDGNVTTPPASAPPTRPSSTVAGRRWPAPRGRRPGPAAGAERGAVRDAGAANHGWTMYPGLLHGAYECLQGTMAAPR
jgi:hypothetical protein